MLCCAVFVFLLNLYILNKLYYHCTCAPLCDWNIAVDISKLHSLCQIAQKPLLGIEHTMTYSAILLLIMYASSWAHSVFYEHSILQPTRWLLVRNSQDHLADLLFNVTNQSDCFNTNICCLYLRPCTLQMQEKTNPQLCN